MPHDTDNRHTCIHKQTHIQNQPVTTLVPLVPCVLAIIALVACAEVCAVLLKPTLPLTCNGLLRYSCSFLLYSGRR